MITVYCSTNGYTREISNDILLLLAENYRIRQRVGLLKWQPAGQTRPAKEREAALEDSEMTKFYIILMKTF